MYAGLLWILLPQSLHAAGVHLSYSVEDDGAVPITARGSFASCRVCDSSGKNCHTVDTGAVYLHGLCSKSGHGSASCTAKRDRGGLHGSHTFNGSAVDCKNSAQDTLTISLDNTPSISLHSPRGTVKGSFEISGVVHFKPTLSAIKGTIYVNFDKSGLSYSKNCRETECRFSFLEDNKHLFDLNHGEHTVTVTAYGGGATQKITETFTVDNMPEIHLDNPGGTVQGSFDINGKVLFKPSLSQIKGSLIVNFDKTGLSYNKNCRETKCRFSFLEDNKRLFDLNHGEHTVTVTAHGGGATQKITETFAVDNMPEIHLDNPRGTVRGSFDIKGKIQFKPSVSQIKGLFYVNFDKSGSSYRKNCKETECRFSFLEDNKRLFDLNHGRHTVTVTAYGGGAVQKFTDEFVVDNMPEVKLTSPKETVHGAFNIAGTAHFQPSVSDIKGSIYVNFDKSGVFHSKNCKEESCEFNYLEDNKRLFDLNHGKHTITVRAIGGGATGSTTEAFTVDNMPVISIEEPESGLVFSPFQTSGNVVFQPVLPETKGTISVYIDNGLHYSKSCTQLSCAFEKILFPSVGQHILKVRAVSGGAVAEQERSVYFENIRPALGCSDPGLDPCASCEQ